MDPKLLSRIHETGYAVSFDPPGDGDCFFKAAAFQLNLSWDSVKNFVYNYLEKNQFDEDGVDRMSFVCSLDVGGVTVPPTWSEVLKLLRENFVTSMVIRAIANALHQKIVIITAHGEDDYVKIIEPTGITTGTLVFAHTGSHYVALKENVSETRNSSNLTQWSKVVNSMNDLRSPMPKKTSLTNMSSSPRKTGEESYDSDIIILTSPVKAKMPERTTISSDSDVVLISSPRKSTKKCKPRKKKISEFEWWSDEEPESEPGISLFRGMEFFPVGRVSKREGTTECTSESTCQGNAIASSQEDLDESYAKNTSDSTSTDMDEIVNDAIRVVNRKPRQKKIGPQKWDGLPCEKVKKLPNGIDGLCCFKVSLDDKKDRAAALQDGRKWKKDSRTEWSGYKNVRFANCWGSYKCTNTKCIYKVEYGIINTLQFRKKNDVMECSLCGTKALYVKCDARRYFIVKSNHITVYHHGEHTCTVRQNTCANPKKDIKDFIRKNPHVKPAQVQSAYILSMVRNREDWDKVDKQASKLMKTKWIANQKQEVRKETEPYGHNFEAVAHFKQHCDTKDPFYIYKLNDNRGNPDLPSFVFKTSTSKVKMAINMNKDKDHFLAQEYCYFDGKHNRAKGYVTLTASVYHSLMRRQIPLATMEVESENKGNVSLFWKLFNEVIQKVSNGEQTVFNPKGWCTDMSGAILSAIKDIFGEDGILRVKTCEFHYKQSVNRQFKKLHEPVASWFKDMAVNLLESETPENYIKFKKELDAVIEKTQVDGLKGWLKWWDERRGFIFRAFAPSGPRMNQAEVIHGGWSQKDASKMTLLKVAEADVRESILLDVEYESYKQGHGSGGNGPSYKQRNEREHRREIATAKKIGEELFKENNDNGRAVDKNSSHRPQSDKKKRKKTSNNDQAAKHHKSNSAPDPERPKPAFGAFAIGILKFLHPSIKVCYGCNQTLKPNNTCPSPPDDLVIVSGCKRSYYDTQNKVTRKSSEVTNVYFHLNPNCVSVHHQFFIPGLITVPNDLIPHLSEEHKERLKAITGVSV